jgi:O-antigen/teichoic acid export membrane protein
MAVKLPILTNTLYQLLAKFVSTAGTLLITVFITRKLGATTWGDYSVVISYITFFYVFTEFGVNSIAAREFSSKKTILKSDFISVFLLRAVITLLISCVSIGLLYFFNYPAYIKQAIIFGQIGLVFFSLASSFNCLFQAKLQYKYLFYSTTVFTIVNVGLFWWVVKTFNISVILLLVPIAIGEIVRFLLNCAFSLNILDKTSKIGFSSTFAKSIFLMSLPLAAVLVINTLMVQIDRLMLSVMVDPLYLGYYSLSYRLFDVLLVFPTFFMNASFPVFAERFKKNKNYSNEFSQSLIFLTFVSILVTVFSLILGKVFIPLIWGIDMYPSVYSFNILVLGSLLFYLSSLVSWCFVVERKQAILIFVYALGFVLNFALNVPAINTFGFVGAATTTILTEGLVVLLLIIFMRRYLTVRFTKTSIKNFKVSTWRM